MIKRRVTEACERYWATAHYSQKLFSFISGIFYLCTCFRRAAYRWGVFSVYQAPIPVIVVGNLKVGGSAKTPLVMALVQALQAKGYAVGVISRGYGRPIVSAEALLVDPEKEVALYGEEPCLIAEKTKAPVAVCANREKAIRLLLEKKPLDLILSDDGLQHYAMARQIEIAVVDYHDCKKREKINFFLLPVGPYREPLSRLKTVDFVWAPQRDFNLETPSFVRNLCDPTLCLEWKALLGKRISALCAIAAPERFFQALEKRGLQIDRHAFPDHHFFSEKDFAFDQEYPLIMTEKDGIKCRHFAKKHWWVLELHTTLHDRALHGLLKRLLTYGSPSS
jgi:tetraacyldisaccharide 4'-kinase